MSTQSETIEVLDLDIISYEDFVQKNPAALVKLKKALYENGIVGIQGIPGYEQKVKQFIEAARQFTALPEEIKESYAPDHSKGETFLGYEKGKEKFKNTDGKWIIDDLKVSYYGFVPDSSSNKWPQEIDLRTSFQELGALMSKMGSAILEEIGLVGTNQDINISDALRIGRMLYYCKNMKGESENPLWCGAHFDHGIFTALLPAFYFVDGELVQEPFEAGLFVKTTNEGVFKKVIANDPSILLFQVGEFGQLISNDEIKATEHKVQKAYGAVERYTMALFFDASLDSVIHSTSVLTNDARYGGQAGDPCTYGHWHEESFKRYIVK